MNTSVDIIELSIHPTDCVTKTTTLDSQVASYTEAFSHFEENRMIHEAYGQRLAEVIRTRQLRHVLSLGIGHTSVAHKIIETLREGILQRYVLVDGSPAIIEQFNHHYQPAPKGLQVLEGFFENFEHAGHFDLIEAGFVLEHVADPALVLRRMHQFLAPGGSMFVAVPNARSLHRLIGYEAGLLPDMYALGAADHQLGHRRYFDLESLKQLLLDAGFRIGLTEGMLLKPLTTGQLTQLKLAPEVWAALLRVGRSYPELCNSICIEVRA